MSRKKAKANRANAQRSTGPRTAAGRAVSRLNATAHGLRAQTPVVPGEDPAEWDRHLAGVFDALGPAGAIEAELAARVALCLWRLRRVITYEVGAVAGGLESAAAASPFAKELERLKVTLGEARQVLVPLESLAGLAERLPVASESAAVDGRDAWHLATDLAAAAGRRPRARSDPPDPAFLSAMGVPPDWHGDPGGWAGWTAGSLMAGVRWLEAATQIPRDDLLDRVRRVAHRFAGDQRTHVAGLEARLAALTAADAASRQRARAGALLPPADVLDKLMRYEGHLTRQLLHAMNTLEQLQRARQGNPGPAPLAVDVTLVRGDE